MRLPVARRVIQTGLGSSCALESFSKDKLPRNIQGLKDVRRECRERNHAGMYLACVGQFKGLR